MIDPTIPYGLHPEVPAERYHERRVGVVSKSALDQLHRSPAHYREWVNSGGKVTPAMAFGSAFHCALLEPEVFTETYACEPDFGDRRFKANKEARKAWLAENAGKQPISAGDMEAIRGMMESIRNHKLVGRMMADGQAEFTVSWQDEDTGLPCKARADYYVAERSMVVDIKTTIDASHDAFRRTIANRRYFVQDALYRWGFKSAGEPIKYFVIVAVEKEPPYAVAVYALDEDAIGKGYTAAWQDIQTMADCVREDRWPSYNERIQTVGLPPWVE